MKTKKDDVQRKRLCIIDILSLSERIHISPKTYLAKRMLPLNSIVMALFATVEVKHHQSAMNTLYNSAAFFKAA